MKERAIAVRTHGLALVRAITIAAIAIAFAATAGIWAIIAAFGSPR